MSEAKADNTPISVSENYAVDLVASDMDGVETSNPNLSKDEQYDIGYIHMLNKVVDFVMETTAANNDGPWSEGYFDAAKDIEEFIHGKFLEMHQ